MTRRDLLVTDLEVLTVTPTSAVICWTTRAPRRGPGVPRPVEASTRLFVAPVGSPLELVADDPTPRVQHRVEVNGLEPGRSYWFLATSDDRAAEGGLRRTSHGASSERRRTFTTLVPPPGEYVTCIALTSDIHIGETRQGIVLGALPTSVRPGDGLEDYPGLALRACLDELRTRHGRPMIVVNGDLTYDNTPEQAARALELLGAYGEQGVDWLATRGNHDHPRRDGDPFGERFVGYQQLQVATEPSGLRILAMDSTRASAGGWITEPQYEQIAAALESDPGRPTLAATHHPVTGDAAHSHPSGPQFMLRAADRGRLQRLEARAPGLFLHHSGHTHRMRRDRPDVAGSPVNYLETASCAAYPGGYTLVHLYTGGYLVNFWRPDSPQLSDWLYRSRWQVFGLGANMMLGSTADRNHVVHADLSGLVPGIC